MHILITGGTGFIGSALLPALASQGHRLTVLTRTARQETSTVRFVTDLDDVGEGIDAVINLAGASLADKRWSDAYKAEMVASRVGTTDQLVAWMRNLTMPPAVLLSGSAIGYYGPSDSERFDESSAPGAGFAADLCQQWESAARQAEQLGVRVALLRLGVVFDHGGGALTEMLRSFQFGMGSWVGSGAQWLSWVHRWDVVRSIAFLLMRSDARGAYNLTAPGAVTHREFCHLASTHKRVLLKMGVPGFVLRTLVGEMADELLLSGQQVAPDALESMGFRFQFPHLDTALGEILGSQNAARSLD